MLFDLVEIAEMKNSSIALIDDPLQPSPSLCDSIFSLISLAFLLVSTPFSVLSITMLITLAI